MASGGVGTAAMWRPTHPNLMPGHVNNIFGFNAPNPELNLERSRATQAVWGLAFTLPIPDVNLLWIETVI